MRLLLDENLDWRLSRDLPGHQTESVPSLGWAGIQNGELLAKAVEAGFDVLVTMDSNMVHQQNTGKYKMRFAHEAVNHVGRVQEKSCHRPVWSSAVARSDPARDPCPRLERRTQRAHRAYRARNRDSHCPRQYTIP